MACSFKSKIIVLGPSSIGKEFFFNQNSQISNLGYEKSFWSVGVSIKTASISVDTLNNEQDYLTMSIWEVNLNEKFNVIYTTFFRGALGCLFFFDITKFKTFNTLNFYLNDIREAAGNIPIYLVGYSNDSNNLVNFEEINHFVERNYLDGFFLIPNQIDSILKELGRKIIGNLKIRSSIEKLNFKLRSYENSQLERFMKFFSICPICKKNNHQTNLKTFYYSKNPNSIELKNKLLTLMKKSKDFDISYLNKISLGIPCCSCFKSLFPEFDS